jgi:hypothetical protein
MLKHNYGRLVECGNVMYMVDNESIGDGILLRDLYLETG